MKTRCFSLGIHRPNLCRYLLGPSKPKVLGIPIGFVFLGLAQAVTVGRRQTRLASLGSRDASGRWRGCSVTAGTAYVSLLILLVITN